MGQNRKGNKYTMETIEQKYPLSKMIVKKYEDKIDRNTINDDGRQVVYNFGTYQVSVIYGNYSYGLEAGLILNNRIVDWPDGSDVKPYLTKKELSECLALAQELSK